MKNKRLFSIFILIVLTMGVFIPITTVATNEEDLSGTYRIKSAVGSNMYLDIDAGSKSNGANLQIWQKSDVEQQIFKITKIDKQYYKLECKHSGKVIDVANGDKGNNANVWQYDSNGTDAQQWLIKKDDTQEGYYNIVSKLSGKYLDVQNAETNNGTNVQLYENNGNKAQKFMLEDAEAKPSTKPVEPSPSAKPSTTPSKEDLSGTYKIKAAIGSNMYLDIDAGSKSNGANLQIWEKSDVEQQKFKITKIDEKYYKLECKNSGKFIDIANGNKANNANVWQYSSNDTDAQQWLIQKTQDGYYNIVSKLSGKYLDVQNAETNNGTNVQVYENNGNKAQKFILEDVDEKQPSEPSTKPVDPSPSTKPSTKPSDDSNKIKPEHTIDNGTYKIRSVAKNNMVIDVSGESKKDNANVQIWEDCDKKNQKFHIKDLGKGYYSIRAVHTKKSLDVENASEEKGTNIKQYEYRDNNDAQQWIIRQVGKDEYNIISKCNNLCLDIESGKTENGTNVQMWTPNDSNAQKFTFEKTTYQEIDDGMYEIQSAVANNEVLGIVDKSVEHGARLQLQDRKNDNSQKFNIKYNKNAKVYTIYPVHSGQALDVKDYGTKNGTPVQQYDVSNNSAQEWTIKDLEDGTYNIVSKCGNLNLDIYNGNIQNGTLMQTWESNGSKAQLFKIEETTPAGASDIYTLDDAKYPGFKSALQNVKNQHPNWNLKIYYTGITWDQALNEQEVGLRSLTQSTGAWRKNNTGYDVSGNWYLATRAAIAYMMDPRNSFDGYIFQFQDLASSSGTYSDIQKMVRDYSYLNNPSCINAILEAAKQGISPFHITSRIMQECGKGGGSMYGYNYKGRKVYNLYNINVSGNSSAGLEAGAKYAYEREWYTPEASIIGGASFLKTNYISVGQSTLYFQKYNVVTKNYSHQYMQNIRAANDEGYTMYKSYRDNGLLESSFTFLIPVYENMPASPCSRPST